MEFSATALDSLATGAGVSSASVSAAAATFGTVAAVWMAVGPMPQVQAVRKCQSLAPVNLMQLSCGLLNAGSWLTFALLTDLSEAIPVNAANVVFTFCLFYIVYANVQGEESVTVLIHLAFPILMLFTMIVFGLDGGKHSKHAQLIGQITCGFNMLLYAIPLSDLGDIVKTRTRGRLTLFGVLASFSCSLCWAVVGVVNRAAPMVIPNAAGVALSSLQLLIVLVLPAPRDPKSEPVASPGKKANTNKKASKKKR